MSRDNRCIKDENGKDVWEVRSTVVIPIIFKLDEKTGDLYTLVEQRGPAVTHTGEWCCPCGFLGWDESLEEACQREVKEETGLELNIDEIKFYKVSTNKYETKQTVDHWYICIADYDQDFDMNKVETKDEVMDLKWLKVANIFRVDYVLFKRTKMIIYQKSIDEGYGTWAFKSHPKMIMEMLRSIIKKDQVKIVDE